MTLLAGAQLVGQIGQGPGTTREAALSGTSAGACCRLEWASTTTVKLNPYGGSALLVDTDVIALPAAGFTLGTTDNLITAAGADAGAAMAIDTLYHVYFGGTRPAFGAQSLRGSATAPTLVGGAYYLGAAGEATQWRYVGQVRTISNVGVPNFADSLTQRLVASYYNRRRRRLFTCPGYADGGSQTTYTFTNTVHAALNAGAGASVEYLTFGEDAPQLNGHFQLALAGVADVVLGLECAAAIAGTDPIVAVRFNIADADKPGAVTHSDAAASGYRTATLTGSNLSAATATIAADFNRLGAVADPAATYLEAAVWL